MKQESILLVITKGQIKSNNKGLPCSSVVRTPSFQCSGQVWVWSLVGELRSLVLCSVAKKWKWQWGYSQPLDWQSFRPWKINVLIRVQYTDSRKRVTPIILLCMNLRSNNLKGNLTEYIRNKIMQKFCFCIGGKMHLNMKILYMDVHFNIIHNKNYLPDHQK